MKRCFLLFSILLSAGFLTACTNDLASTSTNSSSSGTSYSSSTTTLTTTTASEEASWSYSSSNPVYEVSADTLSLTISGLSAGQTVYLTKTNPTSSTLNSSYTQYVSSASNLSLYTNSSSSSSSSTVSQSSSGPSHNHFSPSQTFSRYETLSSSDSGTSRSVNSITSGTKVTQLNLTENDIGSATKELYIDADSNISTYALATATLRAVGDYCYVWVINGYYDGDSTSQSYTSNSYSTSSASSYTTTTDEQITEEIAQSFAEKFDAMYGMIRYIFGNESDEIFYTYTNGTFSTASMDYLSDTGTMVNIVVYDIGADHSSSDSTGVVGYFYAKDYYPNGQHIYTLSGGSTYSSSSALNASNEGKYFYIDAYYSVDYTSMVYSTLAHEFQHMVNWGVKYMDQDLSSGTAYNEMLSMLCEDIMYNYLNSLDSENFTEDDAPFARLPLFEAGYRKVGLEYRSSSTEYILESYSNNYAFGAWVIRQFGGVKILQQMSSNAYVDTDSIVQAVNSVNGTDYTIDKLLYMYTQALVYSCNLTNYTVPTFNTSYESGASLTYTSDDSTLTYGYPIKALDLWDLETLLPETYDSVSDSSYYTFTGPILYSYNAQYDIRPYGEVLTELGTVDENDTDVTITFGATTVYENEHIYILVE